MNFRMLKGATIFAALLLVMVAVMETNAFARAGGGRSLGSSGSRSYSSPATPYTQPAPVTPYNQPYQPQPAGGGFFRNMAGGIVGGMLGGMLFRGLGFGGGFGGSGIGLFE